MRQFQSYSVLFIALIEGKIVGYRSILPDYFYWKEEYFTFPKDFTFLNLQYGNYRIRVRAQGYAQADRLIDVPSATGEYDVELKVTEPEVIVISCDVLHLEKPLGEVSFSIHNRVVDIDVMIKK